MLKFSVATNWDLELLRQIELLDTKKQVTEIFGKLASDFIGGGRPSYALPFISKKKAADYIRSVRKTGRKFNYLLNAACLDNREFTRFGQKKIRQTLEWLDSLGVDAITVTNPYLGSLIKKQFPRFELTVSALAVVSSVKTIKFWTEEIGAREITLHSVSVNRDFALLKKIRSKVGCKLQLTANQLCLYNCPFNIYHKTFVSHASQSHHPLKGFGIDWCLINCRYRMFTHPEEVIKSSWIRPEDVGYYEDIGIDSLKIVDRVRRTENLLLTLRAYLERSFDGNLGELLFHVSKPARSSLRQMAVKFLRFFSHPFYINIFKLLKFKQLLSEIKINVDNRKLDGFLDYFVEGKCKFECEECNYCRNVAERAVYIDSATREKMDKRFREIIDSFATGDIFRYFP
ncbi:MAG: U32 family peptidase [Candidatus Omnitrophica bacterium]|nr:U32 family peptidase [Candidatus Omnitrophota bacterium]